jgi:formamidopyrimidine-DNA glycosylase
VVQWALPELPDIVVYLEALEARVLGRTLTRALVLSPFVLRSVEPPIASLEGLTIRSVFRVGKRVALGFDDDLFLVLHLMIAGRLRWREPGQKPGVGRRMVLAAFEFDTGTLLFTEAGSKKRASMHVVRGRRAVEDIDRGGLEPLTATLDEFRAAVTRENHTLKRSLTDPRLFAGIGNAYSDEILHAARLSPLKLTQSLSPADTARLYEATQSTLLTWIDRLRTAAAGGFPEKVTAFHDEMAVHGRFAKPCPACGAPVQRIVYAENECNYCAVCQTGGRLLADRALSRLLREDWPRRLEDA